MLRLRVTGLEEDLKDLRADIKTVVTDMAFSRGRMEHLPITWALMTASAASQSASPKEFA